MNLTFNNRKIFIPVRKTSFLGRFTGLMLKNAQTENLLFEFKKQQMPTIHSFFVFFPFLAIWLDDKNTVVEYQMVPPFKLCVSPKTTVRKLIEVPLNKKNAKIFEFFVDKKKHLNIKEDKI